MCPRKHKISVALQVKAHRVEGNSMKEEGLAWTTLLLLLWKYSFKNHTGHHDKHW